MKPVIETLQKELDEVRDVLAANQAQRDSLQQQLVQLNKQRDDLKAAIDFLKTRP